MRDTTLMQQALGLASPWTVVRSDFDTAAGRLDVEIDFTPGSRFACPTCGAADCPAYDTQRKTWRHLNVCQHQAYLNARVPRVRCETCARVCGHRVHADRSSAGKAADFLAFCRSRR